jgi:hypothetical protein
MFPKRHSLPIQPIVIDQRGIERFRANTLVRYLLDSGTINMNVLATIDCPQEDREQFAMLIGYSLAGFGELSYVSDETWTEVAMESEMLAEERAAAANHSAPAYWAP